MATLVKRVSTEEKEIFVFGSNLAGHHGGGAAAYAREHYGAIMGQGVGRQGRCYALPTKDENINTLPLNHIYPHVKAFLEYAARKLVTHPNVRFRLTRVGCGLAGLTDRQMAPMFEGAPENVLMPDGWRELSNGQELPGKMYVIQLGDKDKFEVWAVSEGHAVSRWVNLEGQRGRRWLVAYMDLNWWTLSWATEAYLERKIHLNIKVA